MILKSSIISKHCYSAMILGITLISPLIAVESKAADEFEHNQAGGQKSQSNKIYIAHSHNNIDNHSIIAANSRVIPATVNLVKEFEGFKPSAYLDTNGLPVIGYGQTRINGRTVTMGQYITQNEADIALEQELRHIQRIVLSHVKVDLNPHQLGALTSIVYNAGVGILTNSTLVRKLNAGDYVGAAQEFPRWNKAHQGGTLVVFPGLTRRRLAEQQLFSTPHEQIVVNR